MQALSIMLLQTDEYPILFVIAALTKGTSVFRGIENLANKESNRLTRNEKNINPSRCKMYPY